MRPPTSIPWSNSLHPRDAPSASGKMPDMSPCGGPPQPTPSAGNTSGRTVFCQKFQKEMPGLDAPPWPGELGQRVYENISAEAWKCGKSG